MKTRLKMGQMPGDIHVGEKIAMLEGRHPETNRAKAFRKDIQVRERAVLKERARQEQRKA